MPVPSSSTTPCFGKHVSTSNGQTWREACCVCFNPSVAKTSRDSTLVPLASVVRGEQPASRPSERGGVVDERHPKFSRRGDSDKMYFCFTPGLSSPDKMRAFLLPSPLLSITLEAKGRRFVDEVGMLKSIYRNCAICLVSLDIL